VLLSKNMKWLAPFAVVALLATAGTAEAQQQPAKAAAPKTAQASKERKPRGVITLAEVTITGRIQKPIAAVDVARIRPKLTLSELRQPFVERITQAIYKDPF
jgi:hypothetical protein